MKKISTYIFGIVSITALLIAAPASAKVMNKNMVKNGEFSNYTSEFDEELLDYVYDYKHWKCAPLSCDKIISWNRYDLEPNSAPNILFGFTGRVMERVKQRIMLPKKADRIQLNYAWYYEPMSYEESSLKVILRDVRTGKKHVIKKVSEKTRGGYQYKTAHLDISDLKRGRKYDLIFQFNQEEYGDAIAILDNIEILAQGNPYIKGTVRNIKGRVVRAADVTITSSSGEELWSGKTNSKGKFTAGEIPGQKDYIIITVEHKNQTYSFNRDLDWGKNNKYSLRLK